MRPEYEDRQESYRHLASHFLTVFPQLEGLGFSHRWAGAIDTSTQFVAFHGLASRGRVAYAAGFTGLGVGATRFAAEVMLDRLAGLTTHRTRLEMVRSKPLPFPPEPFAPSASRHPLVARPGRPPQGGATSSSRPSTPSDWGSTHERPRADRRRADRRLQPLDSSGNTEVGLWGWSPAPTTTPRSTRCSSSSRVGARWPSRTARWYAGARRRRTTARRRAHHLDRLRDPAQGVRRHLTEAPGPGRDARDRPSGLVVADQPRFPRPGP